jgi:hypothetical protein
MGGVVELHYSGINLEKLR